MARRLVSTAIAGCVVAVSGGVAFALGVTLTPVSGPPGSDVTARVACDVAPEFYVVALDEGAPPGTIVGSPGVEDGPGEWTHALRAGDRDLRITAVCGDDSGTVRFDVEHPAMFPGPTWTNMGEWRPERDNTTVVGTDCPADQASVTFRGAGDTTETMSAATDDHGDWEADIPYAIPAGPVTVVASCGDIAYGPITFERRGPAAPVPTAPATTPAPVPGPSATPASPVGGAPSYTG